MCSFQVQFFVVAVVLCVSALAADQVDYDGASTSKRSFERDCDAGYSVTCFKLDIVSFLEKMTDAREYSIMSGISIVQDPNLNQSKNSEIVADMARSFPDDPEKRLNGFLLAKVSNFLQSHTLNVKLINPSEVAEARSAFEGRKKKKGGLEGIMAAALMMKSMMMALGLGAVALLAGKALMAALMALLLAGLSALKSLTSGGKQSTTYEIIAKPTYSNTHSHSASHENVHEHGGGGGSGYGGYGRSLNFVLPEHLSKGAE